MSINNVMYPCDENSAPKEAIYKNCMWYEKFNRNLFGGIHFTFLVDFCCGLACLTTSKIWNILRMQTLEIIYLCSELTRKLKNML